MTSKAQHIISQYPVELQLILFLSQDHLSGEAIEKIKRLEKQADWTLFFALAKKHRLISHITRSASLLKPEIKKQVNTTHKALSKKALLYSKHLISIHQILKKEHIPHTFFKGPLLSLSLYHDIGFRDYRDLDILVPLSWIEVAKRRIQEQGFEMHAPSLELTPKQRKINYSISHHYHLRKPDDSTEIELHWNLTNPRSYLPLPTEKLIAESENIEIAQNRLPYLSKEANLVFLAAHGAIHQWYRLFWLKDFSEMLRQSRTEEIEQAHTLAEKLKLEKTFAQGCMLSNILYNNPVPDCITLKKDTAFLTHCALRAIADKDLRQQGIRGKIKFLGYRLHLKPDRHYFFSLLFRLRTHYSDWEVLPLPNSLFFLYYWLRPLILFYKFLRKK